jgi:cell volume regulation protein A
MWIVDNLFVVFLLMLLMGIVSGRIAKALHLPDVVLYLLGGILLGQSGLGWVVLPPESTAYQLTITFGTAFILFYGGLSLDIRNLKEAGLSIALLATVGVLLTAGMIGEAFVLAGLGPIIVGLLLGAVISPTDPSTLIPVLEQVKVPARLRTLIEAEAGFNDPTGAVLCFLILHGIQASSAPLELGKFLGLQIVASIILGLLVGLLAALLMNKRWEHLLGEFTPLTIIIAVLAGFYFADKISGSGYLAVFVAGIVVGNMRHFRLTMRHKYLVQTDMLSRFTFQVVKMFIFVLLGSQIDVAGLIQDFWGAAIIALVLVFAVRPLVVLACLKIPRKPHWSWRETAFVAWTRETAVMAAALAGLLLAENVEYASFILHTTFVVILFTLLAQATTAGPLARKLKLTGS